MRAHFVLSLVIVAGSLSSRAETSDAYLLGNWQLGGDVTQEELDAFSTDIDYRPSGTDGGPTAAEVATFNGRTSQIEIPASQAPRLGTGNFTISVWASVEGTSTDLPGEIISQYDPITRKGFRLGIDSRPGVTSSQANWRNVHFGIDNGSEPGEWTDHGRLGHAVLIFGMTVFDGQLFAGTCEAGLDEAGRVFRFDGKAWTDCGAPDRCNSVSSLAVHDGHLYVGVSKYRLRGSSLAESDNPNLGGTVYRYDGDNQWTNCGKLPDVEAINGMVVFDGKLYASSMYAPASFFRYEGGAKWTSCGVPDDKRVESLTVHNGHIYATGYDQGAVYRYDGENWEQMGIIEGATQTYGFATYRDDLYVSEWPNAKVYRHFGGTNWQDVGQLGEEKETMPLVVYNGKMYGGTLPLAEVYRFDEGHDLVASTSWTQVARLDHTPDVRYRRVWTMSVFQGRLFAGVLPSGHVHSIEIGRNVTHDRTLTPGWHHIAAVRDSDHLNLYVDGEHVSTSTSFGGKEYDLTSDQPLRIGYGTTDHFRGQVSDLRIEQRALTPEEISMLAKSG
ncbi:MAG: LamG domain-containing protein [Planctomycetaceae bacterium]|nr:LamG domain-containing protein [Planctomycetaceae bacterium]